MYRFQAVQMCRPCPESELQVSYGILAERSTNQGWTAVTIAGDISNDKAFVRALAERCTHEQLDPVHLADVIRDSVLENRLANICFHSPCTPL